MAKRFRCICTFSWSSWIVAEMPESNVIILSMVTPRPRPLRSTRDYYRRILRSQATVTIPEYLRGKIAVKSIRPEHSSFSFDLVCRMLELYTQFRTLVLQVRQIPSSPADSSTLQKIIKERFCEEIDALSCFWFLKRPRKHSCKDLVVGKTAGRS